ncbi:hypothetical protein LJC16_01515 [Bacteroidales bacterium OttesenSCG-928-C19]|nr:hypothetical protein [Bacteroidales bacterium OttesenSCG-928-C19]
MKQFIFITTLFLFVSCGQGFDTKTTNIDKNSCEQTDINDQSISAIEIKIAENNILVEIALTFINSYVDNCNKMKGAIDIIEWVDSNNLTTNFFKNEVRTIIEKANQEDPELGLGFDPILDAQDFPDEGFEFAAFDDKINFIVVKGKKWEDFKLTIKMILEDNKWLVDGCGIVNIPDNKRSKR